MKFRLRDFFRTALGVTLLALLLLPPTGFNQHVYAQEQTWKINVKNADLEEFVAQVAEITGNTIVVAPQLKGKVTVVSSANLDAEGVNTLFLSVLRTHGYTAVKSGDTIRVEQQAKGKQNPGASGNIATIAPDELVTRVISAQNVESVELMKILRPLIPQYGHIAAVTTPNVVIITDHADNIKRLMGLIRGIDVADEVEVVLVPLKEAWVGDIVALLEQVAPEQLGRNGKGPQRIQLIANERNNTLLLRGKPDPVQEILKLVEALDQPATSSGSTRVFYLEHADAVSLAEIINGLVGQGERGGGTEGSKPDNTNIQADEALNALVVRAEPGVMSEVQSVLAQLDVRRTQVLVEAAIVEISLNDDFTLGVDLAAVDAGGNSVPLITTPTTGDGVNPGALTGLLNNLLPDAAGNVDFLTGAASIVNPSVALAKINPGGISFGAILTAVETNSNANLLSTPSLLTLDNEEASIVVGQEVPFLTGQFTTTTDGANNPFSTIQREDVAIQLTVTPHVHDGTSIRLEVMQEIEDVVLGGISGASDLVTSTRSIDTTVLAEDRQTLVLGGLIQDDVSGSVRKVPLLGDIPLLGRLFRTDTRSREKRTLLLFLRPTIVRNAKDAEDLTKDKYRGIYEVEIRSKYRSKDYLEGLSLEEQMEQKLFESPHLDSHSNRRRIRREAEERGDANNVFESRGTIEDVESIEALSEPQ